MAARTAGVYFDILGRPREAPAGRGGGGAGLLSKLVINICAVVQLPSSRGEMSVWCGRQIWSSFLIHLGTVLWWGLTFRD